MRWITAANRDYHYLSQGETLHRTASISSKSPPHIEITPRERPRFSATTSRRIKRAKLATDGAFWLTRCLAARGIRLGISKRVLHCQAAPAARFDPSLSLANVFEMVCRVISAGCVSVDKGKCFVKKLVGHSGKPDAARCLIRRYMQNGHVQIGREGWS
jgi:hypothetical protein